ncbi:MAG: MBL fold metallo-hydrolase [Cyanobacteriota bacterium]|nr:MBL fold metallo-hydrolase [Cyanobacteriota bacterium]
MAHPGTRLPANAPGPFYVDSRCIDCGTCWGWDPRHFAPAPSGASAHVCRQPVGEDAIERALLALRACPVAAIGAPAPLLRRTPEAGFPALLTRHPAGDVYYCGWASRRSFGASSYLIVRPTGNVLIDSPRFNAPLARRFEALGGLAAIVLTHRDDVADHDRWAARFSCPRWIHAADADAAPDAEWRLNGEDPLDLDADLRLIPTPGHTAGSLVALLGGQILFAGDHLWWSDLASAVVASRTYCWHDWPSQLASVAKLRDLDVRWLLPGHGGRQAFAAGEWAPQIDGVLSYSSRVAT